MRTRERDQIGAPGGEDGIDLVRCGYVADAHGRDTRLVTDLLGERCLEHASIDRLGVAHRLSGRDVHQIDAGLGEGTRDMNCVVAGDAAFGPVGGGDAYRHRLVRRPTPPPRPETFQWKMPPTAERA